MDVAAPLLLPLFQCFCYFLCKCGFAPELQRQDVNGYSQTCQPPATRGPKENSGYFNDSVRLWLVLICLCQPSRLAQLQSWVCSNTDPQKVSLPTVCDPMTADVPSVSVPTTENINTLNWLRFYWVTHQVRCGWVSVWVCERTRVSMCVCFCLCVSSHAFPL